ncbi:hypothetical protein [Streptomyces sp. NEAU-S7GS2]|nr:hypothetical protein [Streptomyces sp. NEAU-S7GS2]
MNALTGQVLAASSVGSAAEYVDEPPWAALHLVGCTLVHIQLVAAGER